MTRATSGPEMTPEKMAHVPSAANVREARLGIFVIGGLLSFVIVLFMLTSPAAMRGRYILVTTMDDAGGVRRGDPIQMRGVNIGRINRFQMQPDGTVDIRMELEGEWQVPTGSTARLGAAGMFGGRTMEILPSPANTYHADFDTIPGEGGSAGGLLGSADELTAQFGDVMTQVQMLLDTATIGTVQGSARELEGLLSQLSAVTREQRGALGELVESLNRSAAGLEDAAAAGPTVASAVARADSAMAMLSATSESLDGAVASLQVFLGRLERGEGTLGRLSVDDALYVSVNDAATQFSSLLADLQANPGKYINISIF